MALLSKWRVELALVTYLAVLSMVRIESNNSDPFFKHSWNDVEAAGSLRASSTATREYSCKTTQLACDERRDRDECEKTAASKTPTQMIGNWNRK